MWNAHTPGKRAAFAKAFVEMALKLLEEGYGGDVIPFFQVHSKVEIPG